MHAVYHHGPRDLRLTEVPEIDRSFSPGQALIRVGAVGICGSDLHLYQTGHIGGIGHDQPFIPGHEFMGIVEAAADGSLDGNHLPLKIGQRVAVDPQVPCRACRTCEEGHPNLCQNHTFFGLHPLDGALREHMIVPTRNCFPIPDSISDAGGAILETLGVAIHALDLAHTGVAQSGVVIGCGPVGLLVLRLAHLAGLRPLIAIDPIQSRVDLARAWGATDTVAARSEDSIEEIHRLTGGRGSDITIEAAWAGPSMDASVKMAAPGSRIILVGVPDEDAGSMRHSEARRKGLTLVFSRRMKHVYSRAIALAVGPEPKVKIDEMITHVFPLADTIKAFEMNSAYGDGVIKAVVRP